MQQGNKPEPKSWGARLREENRGLREKIAALKKEERRLHKQIVHRSKLIHELPGPVLIIQKGKIDLANQAASDLFRYTPQEMKAMDFFEFIHPASKESLGALVRQSGVKGPYESFLMDRTGNPLLCEIQAKKIRYEQGRTALLLTITELSARREKEKDRCETLKREALRRIMSSLSPVLERSVSHLQTGIVELKRSGPGPEQTGLLAVERMAASLDECDRMTRTLHLLTTMEYDPSDISPLPMEEMVKEAVARVQEISCSGSDHDHVRIKTYLRSMASLYGHRLHMREALEHVLMNAVEALPEGGEIFLTTETHSGLGCIYIQDSGPGMPQAVLERIFDPFFTTKPEPGRGLGLSLAQAIVHKHGGRVLVSSLENGGTTVVIELPLGGNPVVPGARNRRRGLKGSNILLVARDGPVFKLIRGVLEEKGALISGATTCGEGLHLIENNHFDLIIADDEVPGLGHNRFISKVKRKTSHLPVLLFNARAKSRAAAPTQDVGPDVTVGRPLVLDRILTLTSALLVQEPV
ncbi:MAG: ATP-binding protein [Desulfatiglandaceae bacterium]